MPVVRPTSISFLPFFAACLCAASLWAAAGDEKPAHPGDKRFDGIELGPGILRTIQPNVRIDQWSEAEIEAYYEVLDFARKTPYAEQQQRARLNLDNEFERFRAELRAATKRRSEQYDRLAEQHPQRAAAYERLKRIAERRLKQQLDQIDDFEDEPAKFPLMARMTKSMIEDKPSRFHGKLVTLSGQIRKLISYDAHPNDYGIKRLYEAWMFTRDSGILQSKKRKTAADDEEAAAKKALGKIPVVVVFTEKPEGMPEGEKILEAATVTGYVFRVHRYADFRDTLPPAPMLLAGRIEWHPRQPSEPTPPWMYAAVFATVAGILLVVFLVNRRDQASRIERRRHTLDEPPPDFTETPSA